jgi:hypothetical protein
MPIGLMTADDSAHTAIPRKSLNAKYVIPIAMRVSVIFRSADVLFSQCAAEFVFLSNPSGLPVFFGRIMNL